MFVSSLLMLGALADAAYPASYTSCGIEHQVDKAPERVITMTQGATEFMLALGLHDHMVGTAYLDDYIWPAYEAEYSKIPVLSSSYPDESTIMKQNPDFIVASFNSAFRQMYTTDTGSVKGIFSNATVAPCAGIGGEELGISDIPSNQLTCRRELNSIGVGTFLFKDACENTSLRPEEVSETTVYEEMRSLGKIFQVDVEHLIMDMSRDFDIARSLVSASMGSTPLKTVWLDCVGRCCQVEEGEEPEVFVGAGGGVPHMLMQEAGLTNVFAQTEGNWACVKESEVIASAPDVIVVVDAAWDSAVGKLTWLYNRTELCEVEAIKAARLVQIPFSATCLSPRNGPAALDLAMAALHVRMGSVAASGRSGVSSFDTTFLQTETAGLQCKLDMTSVVYAAETTTTTKSPSPPATKKIIEIEGTTTLTVEDPAAFMEDASAKEGVQKAIATSSGVQPSEVEVVFSLVESSARRLAQSVQVDFKITKEVAADDASSVSSSLADTLAAISTEDLAAEIVKEVEAAGGGKITVTVASMTVETPTVVDAGEDDEASGAWRQHSVFVCLAVVFAYEVHLHHHRSEHH